MTRQPGQDLLRLEGIGVRLGGREILRDVSFTVAPWPPVTSAIGRFVV